MKKIYSVFTVLFLYHLSSGQTILNQPELHSREVKDPVSITLSNGFHAISSRGEFIARIETNPTSPSNPISNPIIDIPTPPSGTVGSNVFHDTQGNIEVNGSGQLQFTLPIALPPGIKSVAPQINLVYTSGSGNGIAGYGWNLSGITAISRVGKNLDKDGIVKGIELNYDDNYSFNGQRLILKSGEYGKDGAEYTTEKYSNVKIKSVGHLSGKKWQGPEYWEVTFEDGSQAWYGLGEGSKTPVEYNITKWKDAQGNYISYEYTQQDNVAVIRTIKWGGNEVLNKSYFNQIIFNYKGRDLKENSYVSGEKFIQGNILESIQVNANGKQFKKYIIEYDNGRNGTKYQFVKNITEYNSNNEPANPITFEYEKSNQEAGVIKQDSRFDDIYGDNIFTGDFDGDGRMDIIRGKKLSLGRLEENKIVNINYEGDIISIGTGYDKGILYQRNFLYTGKIGNDIVYIYTYKLEKDQLKLVDEYRFDISSYIFEEGPNVQYYPIYPEYGMDFPMTKIGDSYRSIRKVKGGDFKGMGIQDFYVEIVSKQDYFYRDDIDDVEYSFNVSRKIFYLDIKNRLLEEINIDKSISYELGDYDGDGKTDLFDLSNQRIRVYSYSLKIGSFVEKLNIAAAFTTDKKILADFNGDGKTDIFSPVSQGGVDWNMYISTGKEYINYYYSNFFLYEPSWQGAPRKQRNKQRTYASSDLNRDGKSDFIVFESQRWYKDGVWNWNDPDSSYGFHYLRSEGIDSNGKPIFSLAYHIAPIEKDCGRCETINYSGYGEHYIPIFGSFRIAQLNTDFIITHKSKLITWNLGYEMSKISRIRSITQGEVRTEIEYKELDPTKNPHFYASVKAEKYPYMELDKVAQSYAVSQLRQEIAPGQFRKQDFRYRGFVTHLQGKGMIGFRQSARSSWYADGFENTKVWSGVEIAPLNEGLPIKEWSIKTNNENQIFPKDLSLNNKNLLSLKQTEYKIDSYYNGKVKAIVPTQITTKDFIKNITNIDKIEYDNLYLPVKTISNTNNGFAEKTTQIEYYPANLTGEGKNYSVGRPRAKIELVRAYGDSKGAKEEYYYKNNLLKTLKTYNRDNSGYLQEAYEYDGFGNIIAKTISNSIDSNTQKTSSQYDDKGRFVIEKTDNLGLVTQITYNDWGQILTQTDPLGNTLTNTYDAWGKLLTSKTNLGGTTTYVYEKLANSDIKIIEKLSNGEVNISYTNKIGQKYKVSTKIFDNFFTKRSNIGKKMVPPRRNIADWINNMKNIKGVYVFQEIEYDVLGRKIKESEPYFQGERASKWNTIEYDEYSRPIKATAFTGKIVETEYTSNTVKVTETNANNRFKKQTFDAIGNISSTEDKGGIIEFKYNAAGENIEAKYGTNIVTTKYDNWGRKVEFHDPSNGLYKYEYNHGFGLLTKEISPKGEKIYSYNKKGQLISQQERSTDGSNTTGKNITFTYNGKGQILAKNGTSKGKSFSSNVSYDQYGRVISAIENSFGKTYEKKNIVYDSLSRVSSYEKSLTSSGKTTSVVIENVYDVLTGELYQIKDKKTGKILWELKEVNAKGQVISAQLGRVSINNSYDTNGFLSGISHLVENKPTILQISYSFNAIKNELNNRTTGGAFNILESFKYDNNNRLVNWTNPVTGALHYNVYDKQGRIIENDQLGKVKFENSQKIYQATGISLNPAGEEALKNNLIQRVNYNENNDPTFIDGVKGDVRFEYGLTEMRQQVSFGGNIEDQANGQGKYTRYYSEDGSYEVTVDNQTGKEKHILYIGGSPYESNIVYLKDYNESSGSYKFLHKDYLSSILAITDEEGNKLEQRHYDAWGNLTHLQIGNGEILTGSKLQKAVSQLLIDRGYTSHEHFFEVGIIHMNGRLYDPLLRRFLNADENIQDPHNTQNYNKYGYVFNNPLMFNDPSGEFFVALGLGVLFWKSVIIGAAVGLASYTIGLAVTGNIHQWSFGGALKATFFGALGGAVSFGVGEIFSVAAKAGELTKLGLSLQKAVGDVGLSMVQAGTHAISQGVLALMQGADFKSALVGGFFGSLGADAWGRALKGMGYEKFAKSAVGTVAFGALSGGIGAELSGGNFWQGAVTGGIVAGLNHAMHKISPPVELTILLDKEAVGGQGHTGYIIKNGKKYVYVSSDGLEEGYSKIELITGGKHEKTIKSFNTQKEVLEYIKNYTTYNYNESFTIKMNKIEASYFIKKSLSLLNKDYHIINNNCIIIINEGLKSAGHNIRETSFLPRESFNTIRKYFLTR